MIEIIVIMMMTAAIFIDMDKEAYQQNRELVVSIPSHDNKYCLPEFSWWDVELLCWRVIIFKTVRFKSDISRKNYVPLLSQSTENFRLFPKWLYI